MHCSANASLNMPMLKRFVVLDHDLSIEADEVTPTMKIKRNIVSARYKDLLEALYQ